MGRNLERAHPSGAVPQRGSVTESVALPKLVGSAAVPQRVQDATFADPGGDATGGAPDVTTVQVLNDTAGTISFRVSVGGLPSPETLVDIYFNVDRNVATGDSGDEYNIYLDGATSTSHAARWNGSAWVDWSPPTARVAFQPGLWTVTVNRADLNGTGSFDFYLIGSKYSGQQLIGRDDAPNGTAVYTYTLTQGPAQPPPPPPVRPKTFQDASGLPQRIKFVGTSIKHVRLGEKMYQASKRLGVPRVVSVACWSKTDWTPVLKSAGGLGEPGTVTAGFFRRDQPRWLHIAPKQCADVQALISTRAINGQRAYALATVLHERVHAQGVSNEAQTNCYGVQLVFEFARELNFVLTKALRLEQLAVRKSRAVAPRGYWDPARCRDGGAWDIFPEFRNLDYR